MALDQTQREALEKQIVALNTTQNFVADLRKPLDEKLRPFNEIIERLEGIKQDMLEQAGVELLDAACESCDRLLFAGDTGHRCEDGELLCEECSPSYGNFMKQWQNRAFDGNLTNDEKEDFKSFRESYEAHLASGGSEHDKVTYPL